MHIYLPRGLTHAEHFHPSLYLATCVPHTSPSPPGSAFSLSSSDMLAQSESCGPHLARCYRTQLMADRMIPRSEPSELPLLHDLSVQEQWTTVFPPVASISSDDAAAITRWPHMQSNTQWKVNMRKPVVELCRALRIHGMRPVCLICCPHRGPEAHFAGASHFNALCHTVGDEPILLEQWWHEWSCPSGCIRFNYISGEIQMYRPAPAPPPSFLRSSIWHTDFVPTVDGPLQYQ